MGTLYVTPMRKSKKWQQELVGVKLADTQAVTTNNASSTKTAVALPAGTEYVQLVSDVDMFCEIGAQSSVVAAKPGSIPLVGGLAFYFAVEVETAGVAAIDKA